MDDLFRRISEYVILGKKEESYRGYQTLNYVDKITAEITQEEVDQYHPAVGRLFKWLQAAVALRKQDIIRRKAIAKRDREHRDQKIDEKQQRDQARQTAIQEANDAWLAANQEAIDKYAQWQELRAKKEREEEIPEDQQEFAAQELV